MTEYTEHEKHAAKLVLDFYANDSKRWTQGCYAKRFPEATRSVPSDDPEATCWCIEGAGFALDVLTGRTKTDAQTLTADLESALRLFTGNTHRNLPAWNDDPDRTFADIKEFLETVAK